MYFNFWLQKWQLKADRITHRHMRSQKNIRPKSKRFVKRPALFWAGIACIIGGSASWYFFIYKNSDELTVSCFVLVFLGWIGIFEGIFPGVYTGGDLHEITWIPQRIAGAAGFLFMAFFAYANINCVEWLEKVRENYILTQEPIKTAEAFVTEVGARSRDGRSGRLYVYFTYVANGDTINQKRPDDGTPFEAGRYYTVKYSVAFPQMFRLYPK